MTESQFVFAHLLALHNTMFATLPYDVMYDYALQLYGYFLDSDENVEPRGEYACMEKYIINNESFIDSVIELDV